MPWDILIGLAILAIIVAVVHVARHQHAPTLAPAKDVALSVAEQIKDALPVEMAKLPALISSEVARLTDDLAAMEKRAEQAEASFAAEHQASVARLDALGQEVARVITGLGSQGSDALAALTAEPSLETQTQRIIDTMSQAGDAIVQKITDAAAQIPATVEAKLAAEQADHAADLANIGAAVDTLSAQLQPAPEPGA